MASDPLTGRGVLSVSDFMQFASIGRTKLYSEIGAGRLRVRKVGRKTVIAASDAYAWVDSLPTVEVARGKIVQSGDRDVSVLLASEIPA